MKMNEKEGKGETALMQQESAVLGARPRLQYVELTSENSKRILQYYEITILNGEDDS